MQLEDTKMETLELGEDSNIDKSAENVDVETVKNMNGNIEKDVVKDTEQSQEDKRKEIVNPKKTMDKQILKPVINKGKQNNGDKANVAVPQNTSNKNFGRKFNKGKGLPNLTKQPVQKPFVPVANKMVKKPVPRTPKSKVMSREISPVLAVVPNLKKSLLRKYNSKLPPLKTLEKQDQPEKKLTLMWSRAESTELSEVSKMYNCNSQYRIITNLSID